MRLFLSAALAVSLMSGAAFAAEEDEILSDLVVVTATPRPADMKMVVQTAKSLPIAHSNRPQVKIETAASPTAPQPIKTASK